MDTDNRGNEYVEISNLRITYVDGKTREESKNWAGKDMIRFQSYKGPQSKALHTGAEVPLDNAETLINIIAGLCRLYKTSRN